MRDMRRDLRERIQEIESEVSELVREYNREKSELDKKYASKSDPLEDERLAINTLFNIQQKRFGGDQEVFTPTMPLADFMVKIADKLGTISKDNLRQAAFDSGYFQNGEPSGRTIHTTLLNLVRGGRLREGENGLYYRVHDAPSVSALSKLGEGVPS